jgi:hypothetical protein
VAEAQPHGPTGAATLWAALGEPVGKDDAVDGRNGRLALGALGREEVQIACDVQLRDAMRCEAVADSAALYAALIARIAAGCL